MGIPDLQRSSCWSSSVSSAAPPPPLLPPLSRVQYSSSSFSSTCWTEKRPTVNCCSTKIATKLLSSPVIDRQFYCKRQKASIAVVMVIDSRVSSSSMPAQEPVEEEEEEEEEGKPASNEVTVVGAGPAGCLLAIYLLRRGFSVDLFEKRDRTIAHQPGGLLWSSYSYNMVLASRATKALEGAGLDLPLTLLNPLVGARRHLANGKTMLIDYSNEPGVQTFGVSRNALVGYLQESLLLGRYPKLKTYFGHELVSLGKKNTARFRVSANSDMQGTKEELVEVKYDLIVGADGANSTVRSQILRLEEWNRHSSNNLEPIKMDVRRSVQNIKSFYIGPLLARTSFLDAWRDRVQGWSALNLLFTGMADGSFWGATGHPDLLSATTSSEVEHKFRQHAPEMLELLLKENPNFAEDFVKQPSISAGSAVLLSRFHHDNILLIGDAAHAMFSTYGTGCNAALEDCFIFDKILADFPASGAGKVPFDKVAAEFTRRRREDAHAIVNLNTTRELFPQGLLGVMQMRLLTTLHKLAPKFFKRTSFSQLWSDMPFTQIKLQKRMEDRFFYGLLFGLGVLALSGILFLLGVRTPSLNPKPTF